MLTAPVPYVSAETKVPLKVFSHSIFFPVTRIAPGCCTNPINRQPMAPPGQLKTPPLPHPSFKHTQPDSPCSLPPLLTFLTDNSCLPSTNIAMNNDTKGCGKTKVNDEVLNKLYLYRPTFATTYGLREVAVCNSLSQFVVQ